MPSAPAPAAEPVPAFRLLPAVALVEPVRPVAPPVLVDAVPPEVVPVWETLACSAWAAARSAPASFVRLVRHADSSAEVGVPDPPAVGVALGVPDALGDGDTLAPGLGDTLGPGDTLGVPDTLGDGDTLGLGLGLGLGDTLGPGDTLGVPTHSATATRSDSARRARRPSGPATRWASPTRSGSETRRGGVTGRGRGPGSAGEPAQHHGARLVDESLGGGDGREQGGGRGAPGPRAGADAGRRADVWVLVGDAVDDAVLVEPGARAGVEGVVADAVLDPAVVPLAIEVWSVSIATSSWATVASAASTAAWRGVVSIVASFWPLVTFCPAVDQHRRDPARRRERRDDLRHGRQRAVGGDHLVDLAP